MRAATSLQFRKKITGKTFRLTSFVRQDRLRYTRQTMDNAADRRSAWTFLTNHARVLLAVAADPHVRMRDMAAKIGITERAAQGIVADLVEAGYLERIRVGRRNHYQIRPDQHFRHPAEADMPVQVLIDMFTHRDLPSGALRKESEPVLT
ncbi:helix-turn-helix transcriptional regulator [Nonomuraea recticatena]